MANVLQSSVLSHFLKDKGVTLLPVHAVECCTKISKYAMANALQQEAQQNAFSIN